METSNDITKSTIKITSPKTGKKITVGKSRYRDLMKEGYTEDYLLGLTTNNMTEINLPEDVLFNIIINSTFDSLLSLYNTNKLYKKILDDQHTLNILYDKYYL